MPDYPLSPDIDSFSTPPTTPGPAYTPVKPSLSRKSSRPSSLIFEQSQTEWKPDIEVETSPGVTRKPNGHAAPVIVRDSTFVAPEPEPPRPNHYQKPIGSPCFVHSHLDKGVSMTDWLRTKQKDLLNQEANAAQVKPDLIYPGIPSPSHSTGSSVIESTDEDDEYLGNLTKHLAETAVGVREMSKQLGRARVRSNIQSILIITKARDNRLIQLTRDLAIYLMLKKRPGQSRGLIVYVDTQLRKSKRFDVEGLKTEHPEFFLPFPHRRGSSTASSSSSPSFSSPSDEGQLRYWTMDMCSQSPQLFDFVVTLGGDGTVLFTSWLFQRIVPPVISFALGSLGFLTNFDFSDHQAVMDSAVDAGIRVNLRMRFTCTVYRAVAKKAGKGRKAVKNSETGEIMMKNIEQGGWEAIEGNPILNHPDGKPGKEKEIMCFTTRPVETFEVLNELVVDRGPSPYVSLLELFGDEHHMTTVQADGLLVSTPTGSTAYSLSAGGSLVHPEIPSILITPICPHTLSFRPMLLPDTMELRICVPFNSRSTAWASFDGRGRVELKQGDHIKVTASKFPFPTVCAGNQSSDWFQSISRTLKWNERERQKSFVVVEENPEERPRKQSHKHVDGLAHVNSPLNEEDDDSDDEEEEEDQFDIDSSPDGPVPAAGSPQEVKQEEQRVHRTLGLGTPKGRRVKSRSRSPVPTSGIESPNRYAGPHPHIPARHVGFKLMSPSSESSTDSGPAESDQNGLRDSRRMSSRSRIPRDRDLNDLKTPTAGSPGQRSHQLQNPHHVRLRSGQVRSRSADVSRVGHRAFAVWGHDESDSNASDSDA